MAARRLEMAAERAPTRAEPVLEVEDLRACYQMRYFGIVREVRAVDDISPRDPGTTRSMGSPANRAAARPR